MLEPDGMGGAMNDAVRPGTLPVWPPCEPLPPFLPRPVPRHVHLLPSLSMGGAERMVVDLARGWAECGTQADVVALRGARVEHRLSGEGVALHTLAALDHAARLAHAAELVLRSGLPAYCHLVALKDLRQLWERGCRTIPVVHNISSGWKTDPREWRVPQVPFVVACGEAVAGELRSAGLDKPVRVLRHVVPSPPVLAPARRTALRAAFGAGDTTLLIGMIGRVVPQKNQVRAVSLLRALLDRGIDARLAIIGPVMGDREADAAIERLAAELRVRHRIVRPGAVADAGAICGAFDVLLNTSLWEGLSLATLEAVAAGVPVVSSDVGGQREAVHPGDALLDPAAADTAWVEAILAAPARRHSGWTASPPVRRTAAHLWPWWAAIAAAPAPDPRRLLIVTGDLDVGGAQRSLCNLAGALPTHGLHVTVAVAGPVGVTALADASRRAGARFLCLGHGAPALPTRAHRVIDLALAERAATMLFWNLDASLKLALLRAFEGSRVKVCDVSPGPDLFSALERNETVARFFGLDGGRYLERLDGFVAKHQGGLPERVAPARRVLIPNGVVDATAGTSSVTPGPFDPALAVVTVGRLHPSKRPELLPGVARALARRVPGASLHVVGGAHLDANGRPGKRAAEAWSALHASCGGTLPANLVFAGPHPEPAAFLRRFAVFYMVSTGQGCPNASLEAMCAGLPVVANPDGGTAEQVEHGVNGFLVADPGCPERYAEELAEALAQLLTCPALAQGFGAAGRERVLSRFSIDRMAQSYAGFVGGLHAISPQGSLGSCSNS
ncbi:MAG: glycosyltransferase [Nevskia sp.]|nr:glycosyltransferase [Nevskia sp.]